MKKIPYTRQTLQQEDHEALFSCLNQDWITRGPGVRSFESAITKYCGSKYAVLFNSGSVAIQAACYAANLNPKDQIVSSPNTFVGTLSGALSYSQNLTLLDIDLETGSPSFDKIAENESFARSILIPVHYSGIAKFSHRPRKEDIIIEDACQAFGARYPDGAMVGSCIESDMTVFSFHPAKTLCMGEGGLVSTNSTEYYERLCLFRNNGIIKTQEMDPWMYEVHDLTNNYNVTEFQAALGLSQLKRVDSFLTHRRACTRRYRENLKGLSWISFFPERFDEYSSHNLLPVQIKFEQLPMNRKELMLHLSSIGIGAQVHFIPLYRHPYFEKHFNFRREAFKNMERFYSQALSLPLHSSLTFDEIDTVTDALKEASLLDLAKY